LEVVVAYLTEELKLSRRKAVLLTFITVAFFGLLCSLSEGSLSELKFFGKNIFALFDYLSSNILLPAGGLLIVLFTGWKMKKGDYLDELSNNGTIAVNKFLFNSITFSLKFLAPVAITVILLNGLGLIKLF